MESYGIIMPLLEDMSATLHHVPREANGEADRLAKLDLWEDTMNS